INVITVLLILLAILCLVVGVIFVQQAIRKIPIQYAKKLIAGGRPTGGENSHLPIKVNAAGVIPVIFAMALFIFPSTIAGIVGEQNPIAHWVIQVFDYTHPAGMAIYVLLIIAFSYF
ncbi:preprotein translocase subunit SecY, partial [Pseudomonas sp. 2588-5]